MRKDDIKQEIGIEGILEIIEKEKLCWYRHIKRMEESR